MNHQKLAQTLLRILGIWLIAQSLSQLAATAIVLYRAALNSRSASLDTVFAPAAVGVIVLIGSGVLLIALSGRLARAIADEA